jgi:acyl-CoA thioesterase I
MMIGCGEAERNLPPANPASAPAGAGAPAAAAAEPTREGVVLFVGTSLTAGYGLREDQSFPLLVQRRIDEAGLPFRVINAGVSGETSAGALRRADWLLQQPFDVLVFETGGNDMLRGTDPETTERNISAFIERVREQRPDATIILAGMMALPNLGAEYIRRFESIYPRIAERHGLTLIPFLLDGVAAERQLNLDDGIHPNPEGQRIVAGTVWEVLEPVLRTQLAEVER